MAPPPPSPLIANFALFNLILRVLTFVFALVSLILIATLTYTLETTDGYYIYTTKFKFSVVYAYRYMLSTAAIGMFYSLSQTAFAIYLVTMGTKLIPGHETSVLVADKVVSYLLATGAAAGFGYTVDANRDTSGTDLQSVYNKANAAASILFIAFLFSAASSLLSSLTLCKSGCNSTNVPDPTYTPK